MGTKKSLQKWFTSVFSKPNYKLLLDGKQKELDDLKLKLSNIENTIEFSEFTSVDLDDIDPDELVFPDTFDRVISKIPEGWFVFEAAQSPTSQQWYCHLVEFDSMFPDDESDEQDVANVKRIDSGEHPTLTAAVKVCLSKLEAGEISTYE